MNRELIINVNPTEVSIALCEDKVLVELNKEQCQTGFSVGDIYLGRVRKIMPGLNAAFVNIGHEKDAFIHYLDLGADFTSLCRLVDSRAPGKRALRVEGMKLEPQLAKEGRIGDHLQVGQTVMVQIAKEAISTKGPRLTAEISLAGRNVVLVPFSNKVFVSAKIRSNAAKKRLRKVAQEVLPQNFGVIIRTAAADAEDIDIMQDILSLVERWNRTLAAMRKSEAPARLMSEMSRVNTIIRDSLNDTFSQISVDDEAMYNEIKSYVHAIKPDMEHLVKLYKGKVPIFDNFDVAKQIKSLFAKYVSLRRGAYLIIEHTEAMHVIDVNSGNRTKAEDDQEQTALEVNLAAAAEIARQLRLRDMGGIVIIDFIDMRKAPSRQTLYQEMQKLMATDKAKHTILPLTKFGLMQITRQRVRPIAISETSDVCPTCHGTGKVEPTMLLEKKIEGQIQLLAEKGCRYVNLRVSPYVKSYLCHGLLSLRMRWIFKYKLRIKVSTDQSVGMIDVSYLDKRGSRFSQSNRSDMDYLKGLVRKSKRAVELKKCLEKRGSTVHLEQMVGGAYSLYAADMVEHIGGIHIFLSEDRDRAAYLVNDLYELLDEERVAFFSSGYKRSVTYGAEDAQGIVRRTATLNAVSGFKEGYLAICTYPEALAESVTERVDLEGQSRRIRVGDRLQQADLVEWLAEQGFVRVDFVYEPGQYSVRGGIVDVFSYVESRPYRIDFFGDEVDSLRRFDISSQLSAERPEEIDIIPNTMREGGDRVSLARFVGEATWWIDDGDYALRKIADIRKKVIEQAESEEDARQLAERVTSRQALLKDWEQSTLVVMKDNIRERQSEVTLSFNTAPQPAFNRNFEMLADDVRWNAERGYTTSILSHNKVQIERLQNIFHQVGRREVSFRAEDLVLHEGFIDNDLNICVYTDHQIFDRYQRYRIRGEIKRDEQMTVAELNALKVGDYVVHIDHGVGRFGGLVRLNENGRTKEVIKLIYKDNDILFVNVHALHRISRYKSGEGEPPKIYKLGNGAWQKLKATTKKAVKDISRELIALYAKRKASKGYAFSEDGYLQQELEASFKWEDTPDQQTAIAAVKRDMESNEPMDRLVCGDVGFGKTEVAIRAAFKAAVDGKQTAVLVPTTILALQHYRSFMERLRDLPVTVEYINRTKSAKEARRIAEELKSGKIDILIGTHKMLSKQIEFHDLGLLIIDEEQKFGVAAKEKLTQLSVAVDTLTLTATPIPRTLQFSLMGSRDLSVISTPPPNRQPIVTESHTFSEEVIRDAIEEELARGGQVYFVHNRVEDLPVLQGMITRLCPKARVMTGHGRMPAEQLEKLIMDFIYGEFDVLLATTIIENGIDIGNANTIIINDAHRFGLSDLHQLRGRVGRSDRKGFCYLLSPPDELIGGDARRRLRAIEEFSDLGSGFNIAMQDLDIRGAGNLLGAEQSGFIADVGIETYQKILNQAISELRAEGLDISGLSQAENDAMKDVAFVDDATIDIDIDASIPDSYVRSQAEKLRLYREIDAMRSDEEFDALRVRLKDRFGALPEPVEELINVVKLRREAVDLGMEHVKVKNGLLIARFVGDNNSPFFKTDTFLNMLRRVVSEPERFVVKQYNNRLSMTVRKIYSVAEGVAMLRHLKSVATEKTEK